MLGEWGGKAFSLFVENSDIRINGGFYGRMTAVLSMCVRLWHG